MKVFLEQRAYRENAKILLVRSNPNLEAEYIDLVRELKNSMFRHMEVRLTQIEAAPFKQITYEEEFACYLSFDDNDDANE